MITPYRGYYRPYYSPFFSLGLYGGYPYGYYSYGLYGGYGPYGYAPYGYGPYGYGPYGYRGYPAEVYGYAGGGYQASGGVRIEGGSPDAQVFVDGYYAGVVDDFDGAFQHLNLQPGAHRVEIRGNGGQPASFDVRIEPGQTITYHAAPQP